MAEPVFTAGTTNGDGHTGFAFLLVTWQAELNDINELA